MSTLATCSVETHAAEDPRNTLVRAFDAYVQAMIDNGCEAQARAVIARLLPPPVQNAAPATLTAVTGNNARLILVTAVSVLRGHASKARTPATQQQHAALADGLSALMNRNSTDEASP